MKSMTRKYELKKRAERQDETRQRIVEAAVALHEQLGPWTLHRRGLEARAQPSTDLRFEQMAVRAALRYRQREPGMIVIDFSVR